MAVPLQTATDFALEVIEQAESQTGLSLTAAAKQILTLPIEEASQKDGFDLDEASSSISRLIAEMAKPAYVARADPDQPHTRDAQAVIRAITMHFCDIPPFCDKTGR